MSGPSEKDEEKRSVSAEAQSVESFSDADEALKLVGQERKEFFTEEYNARLRRKLDMTIVPLCAAVYFTQFMDKTALNYASIMGFPIKGQHYNLVALSFYLGYFSWVSPTMYIAQKLRLGKYLGVNIVLWGILLTLHVIPNTFGAFFGMRFLLGMLESCVAPTLILIISMFYKKDEQARRISWFYVMNSVSAIFGGFLAYGVSFSTSKSFLPYKTFYIVLGILAIIVGICVIIYMPDSPVTARMLTEEEKIAAIERVRDDQGGTENKIIKRHQMKETFLDVRTWLIVLTTLLTNIPNGGLANFSNIIVENFGYTAKQTLILSTPAGAVGIVTVLFCGWYSDKRNDRMTPIVFSLIPTLIGAALLVGLNHSGKKGALLFSTYLIGTFGSSLATIYAWNASNTSGYTKKGSLNVMTLAAFCVGNVVGTETFLPKDAPDYLPGKISILVLLSTQFFVCLIMRLINQHMNRQKTKIIEGLKVENGWSDEDVERERQKHAFLDLTDKENPYFVYTN